ncbi:MAG: hypothetical protein OIF40_03095 [Mangrovicoccus sp.]|nr:hypothetical protein [Mangrovicoccus sp.]
MLLERTLTTLQTRAECPTRAQELGTLGYLQWLAGLRPGANYLEETQAALRLAQGFEATDPAVAAFCALLRASTDRPLQMLELTLPERKRRGGAKARRRMM